MCLLFVVCLLLHLCEGLFLAGAECGTPSG